MIYGAEWRWMMMLCTINEAQSLDRTSFEEYWIESSIWRLTEAGQNNEKRGKSFVRQMYLFISAVQDKGGMACISSNDGYYKIIF